MSSVLGQSARVWLCSKVKHQLTWLSFFWRQQLSLSNPTHFKSTFTENENGDHEFSKIEWLCQPSPLLYWKQLTIKGNSSILSQCESATQQGHLILTVKMLSRCRSTDEAEIP